ncbi:MAG: hypothetical protein B0W54_17505 [Cellvibrio sp. 79]|nr:MAG: hypothetical protein B0W54_17505 [Cellvibrio sp. 79]
MVDIELSGINPAACNVTIVDAAAPTNPIDIIARVKEPLYWTDSSPRCIAADLDAPVSVKKSRMTL